MSIFYKTMSIKDRVTPRLLTLVILGLICASGSDLGIAQEALRMSMTGATAAEARRLALISPGYYNLELGPTYWSLRAGVGYEYNDNVYLRATNRLDDSILSLDGRLRMLWPITEKNALNVSWDGGYKFYVQHDDLSRFFVRPGSEIAWDVYVGDFMFNVHNRLSLTEAAYENPTIAGTGKYKLLDNAAGVFILGDLNKLVVSGGYDHVIYDTSGDIWVGSDADVDSFYFRAGLRFRPDMEIGAECGYSIINFDDASLADADQWNVGGYYQALISPNLKVGLHAGYTLYRPEAEGPFAALGDKSTIYIDLTASHRVNKFLSYETTFGRVVNLSFYGYSYELWFVHLRPRWSFIKDVVLTTPFYFEKGKWHYDVYGIALADETFDRIGGGIFATKKLAKRLEGRIGWEYLRRTAELATWKYHVNRFTLNLVYSF